MTDFEIESYAQGLKEFITASPCASLAAKSLAETFTNSGFTRLDPTQSWISSPGKYFLQQGGAIIAWLIPDNPPQGFRIIGSHTDSPAFKLKPTPDSFSPDGWGQLNVEIYGECSLTLG